MDELSCLVGGRRVAAASGDTFESVNPATGEVIARLPRCRAEDIDLAVRAATAAAPDWQATPAVERARLIGRLADAVVAHGEELAVLDVVDNGSPVREMRNDAHIAAAQLRYFAGVALQLRGDTIPGEHGRLDYTLREPFGVVGRIIPFNHPLMFAAGRSAAPLVAGNTAVLKPSEHTSLSALRLGELAGEILPPGVLNVVTGFGGEAGDALVVHPGVRRLAFTGSAAIGRSIQRRAATHVVKSVSLELGGKNPIVVFPDADVEAAVDGALRGMNFTWQGQSCGSTSRLLVHSLLHREFVDRLGCPDRGTPQRAADGGVHRHRRDRPPAAVREGDELHRARPRGGRPGRRRRRAAAPTPNWRAVCSCVPRCSTASRPDPGWRRRRSSARSWPRWSSTATTRRCGSPTGSATA